jgi:hypothetical protein
MSALNTANEMQQFRQLEVEDVDAETEAVAGEADQCSIIVIWWG